MGRFGKLVASLGLTSALFGFGCKAHFLWDPSIPPSEPFDPPIEYRQIWQKEEECTGRTGNFNALTWRTFSDYASNAYCSDKEKGCWEYFDSHRNIFYIREDLVPNADNGWIMDDRMRGASGHGMRHALGFDHDDYEFKRCEINWEEL